MHSGVICTETERKLHNWHAVYLWEDLRSLVKG